MFTDYTTKVDSEPPNGSNDDITNPYECNQTLYFSAGTSNSNRRLLILDGGMLPNAWRFGDLLGSRPLANWSILISRPRPWLTNVDLNPMSCDSNVIRWQKRIFLHLNLQDEMNRSFIAQNSYRLERETFSKILQMLQKILSSIFQCCLEYSDHDAKTRALGDTLSDNIVPKPDLALELGKSISFTEAEEEAVARKVHARIVSGPDPEPMQEDQTGSNSGKLHVSLDGTKTLNDQEKSKVIEESDSTIPDPSHQTVTSTPPVIAPFTEFSYPKPNGVARLEQEMSEVKKTDHSADVLASIESQVPTAVDKYLGTKLDNALLKVLERHTADLIEKHSVLPGLESIQNQESEKSPKEIIRTKREQGEEKQDSTYSIRSTDKVDLEEFDLKSALFKHMI
ncbi:hypothetical protein Tco_0829630 [Tanacetum coccineum]